MLLNFIKKQSFIAFLNTYTGGLAEAPVEFVREELVELANDKLLPCV